MGIRVYDEKYQTVNANSLELVVGLDRSLFGDKGCYQGEQRFNSANRIHQLTEENKSQKEEILRLRKKLAEFNVSKKRKQEEEGRRKMVRHRGSTSSSSTSTSASASAKLGGIQSSRISVGAPDPKRLRKGSSDDDLDMTLPGPTGQLTDGDVDMTGLTTGPTGPTGNNK